MNQKVNNLLEQILKLPENELDYLEQKLDEKRSERSRKAFQELREESLKNIK